MAAQTEVLNVSVDENGVSKSKIKSKNQLRRAKAKAKKVTSNQEESSEVREDLLVCTMIDVR